MLAQSLVHVRLFVTLQTVASNSSVHAIFQEYLSELPFSFPGDFPTQGSNLCLLILSADSLPLSHLRSWSWENNILKMLLGDENLPKLVVEMVTFLCEYAKIDSFQWVNYISIKLF